jgi:hypothetical protein
VSVGANIHDEVAELNAILGEETPGSSFEESVQDRPRSLLSPRSFHARCWTSFGHRQWRQVVPLTAMLLVALPMLCSILLYLDAVRATVVGNSDWSVREMLGAAGLGVMYGVIFAIAVGLPVVQICILLRTCWYTLGDHDGDDDSERAGSVDLGIWLSNLFRCSSGGNGMG